ncbi:MAG: hypothetical protein ABW023_15570, partial [Sphingomonas sp.]
MAQLLAMLLLASGSPPSAQDGERPRTDAPVLTIDKIVPVGDSVMAPMSGWGAASCAEHVASSVARLDLGRGAHSTRSYHADFLGVLGDAWPERYPLTQFADSEERCAVLLKLYQRVILDIHTQ